MAAGLINCGLWIAECGMDWWINGPLDLIGTSKIAQPFMAGFNCT